MPNRAPSPIGATFQNVEAFPVAATRILSTPGQCSTRPARRHEPVETPTCSKPQEA